jgi:hypothetical protein
MFSKTSLSMAALLALALASSGANAQAQSDTSDSVAGQASSDMPAAGAGSKQMGGPHSEDQGGTGIKASEQGEGATNKDTTPRDSSASGMSGTTTR